MILQISLIINFLGFCYKIFIYNILTMNIIFKKLKIKNLLLNQKEWILCIDSKLDHIEFDVDDTHLIRVNFEYIIKMFGIRVCVFKKVDNSVFGYDLLMSNNYYLIFNPYLIWKLYKVRRLLKQEKKSEEMVSIMAKMPQSLIRNKDIDDLLD